MSAPSLTRLLQLASPALPVGAYSYSQGLEAAIEAGIVRDAATARIWIEDVLRFNVATLEAPVLLRLIEAWQRNDLVQVEKWNGLFLASRESAELRAETAQMGYSLARLLRELNESVVDAQIEAGEESASVGLAGLAEIAFPTAFAYAVVKWHIEPADALTGYLWSWAENQVMAALKAVPLGQTDGQRLLLKLGDAVDAAVRGATDLSEADWVNFAPGLALLSARHETQYSRLFRS
jgi:urease accessory protein